jgi:hypothetical protein
MQQPGEMKQQNGMKHPSDMKSSDMKPGDLKSGDMKPGEMNSGEMKSGAMKPQGGMKHQAQLKQIMLPGGRHD